MKLKLKKDTNVNADRLEPPEEEKNFQWQMPSSPSSLDNQQFKAESTMPKTVRYLPSKKCAYVLVATFVLYLLLWNEVTAIFLRQYFYEAPTLEPKEFQVAEVSAPTLSLLSQNTKAEEVKSEAFQLDQPHCRVPVAPIKSEAYTQSFGDRREQLNQMKLLSCDEEPEFSKLEGHKLILTDNKMMNCCMLPIVRQFKLPGDDYSLGGECKFFDPVTHSMDVSDTEFIMVGCNLSHNANKMIDQDVNGADRMMYSFHMNVPKNFAKEKAEFWKMQKQRMNGHFERPPNIFMLVIDSTSRTDLIRSLPKLKQFMDQNDFVDFKGHTPVGEPTKFNAFPLLTGKHLRQIDNGRHHHWDDTPFIWKKFSSINYITGFLEDVPSWGTFNYGGQKGFMTRPTDVYPRPTMLAHSEFVVSKSMHGQKDLQIGKECFGRRNIVEFLMDNHLEVLKRFKDAPSFLLPWHTYPFHDIPTTLGFQDEVYLKFFKAAFQDPDIVDNTIFIVMSDHGFWMSGYSDTYEGLLERRNVPIFIRLPERLKQKNPEMISALRWNSKILTSHYDVHKTLLNLVHRANSSVFNKTEIMKERGMNLLEKLPASRTCQEALIPRTMCPCGMPVPQEMNAEALQRAREEWQISHDFDV